MEQFKRAKVMMLPTKDNHSQLEIDDLSINKLSWELKQYCHKHPQHLYIISDEEIKEGDWYIMTNDFGDKYIVKVINLKVIGGNEIEVELLNGNKNCCSKSKIKKIIATTDTSLNYETPFYGMDADNNFPQPSQQFIEKYIKSYNKGEVITDVLVEYELENINIHRFEDELKVNPKDNTIIIKKLKNSWNREEVIELFKLREKTIHNYYTEEEWIEENL